MSPLGHRFLYTTAFGGTAVHPPGRNAVSLPQGGVRKDEPAPGLSGERVTDE